MLSPAPSTAVGGTTRRTIRAGRHVRVRAKPAERTALRADLLAGPRWQSRDPCRDTRGVRYIGRSAPMEPLQASHDHDTSPRSATGCLWGSPRRSLDRYMSQPSPGCAPRRRLTDPSAMRGSTHALAGMPVHGHAKELGYERGCPRTIGAPPPQRWAPHGGTHGFPPSGAQHVDPRGLRMAARRSTLSGMALVVAHDGARLLLFTRSTEPQPGMPQFTTGASWTCPPCGCGRSASWTAWPPMGSGRR